MITKLLAALDANSITGTNLADRLSGTSGDDIIFGLGGRDNLQGGGGDDLIDGGTGADRMFGGRGDDTYIVDNPSDRAFEVEGDGTDTVLTALHLFTLKSRVENLTFTNSDSHFGKGNFADNTITGNAGADSLHGLGGNDNLLGLGGVDKLYGGNGDDVLDGGLGADRMMGGSGDDTYVVDNRNDEIFERQNAGVDTVLTALGGKLGVHVENMTLTGIKVLDGTGNASDNVLVGNTAQNVLSGLDGEDTIDGGGGKDTLIGGAGADQFLFSVEPNSSSNVDVIRDFSTADHDSIVLDASVFLAFRAAGTLTEAQFYAASGAKNAHDGNDRVIYDTKTGILYYDSDGTGDNRAVQIAVLGTSVHPELTFADIQIVL